MVINLFRRLQLDRNEIIIPQRLLINFKLLLSFDLPASTFFHRSRHLPIPSRGLEGPLNKQFEATVAPSPVASGHVAGSRYLLSLSLHSLLLLSDRVPAVAVRHLHCRRLRAGFYASEEDRCDYEETLAS